MDKNVFLSSKSTVISENKTYLELLNRVCYYSEPNQNGVRLPFDDTSLEKAQSLVGMPVVAKYTVDAKGKPTFKGHEATIDADGEISFGTTPIGVHTEVYIQEDAVELPDKTISTLPCLFAKQKVWKRNKNAVAAINRLYSEGNLHNSWEIGVTEYRFLDGVKDLIEYVFEANCLLGLAKPAYGPSAKILNVASKSSELLVAEALSQDLLENDSTGSEGLEMEEEKIVDTAEEIAEEVVATDEPAVDNPETDTEAESAEAEPTLEIEVDTEEPELSALTDNDLRDLLYRAIDAKLDRKAYTFMVFPEAHEVWAKRWDSKETEMFKFTYTVDGDSVTVSEPEPVVLIVAPRNINSAMDEKNAALIDAQKQINELTAQVAALEPYREAAEQAEREKAEAQHKEAVAQLKQYARESGMLSEDELDAGEIAQMIEELKETEVKVLIADRIVGKQKPVEVETSDAKEQPGIYTDLSATSGDTSYSVFRSKVFGK